MEGHLQPSTDLGSGNRLATKADARVERNYHPIYRAPIWQSAVQQVRGKQQKHTVFNDGVDRCVKVAIPEVAVCASQPQWTVEATASIRRRVSDATQIAYLEVKDATPTAPMMEMRVMVSTVVGDVVPTIHDINRQCLLGASMLVRNRYRHGKALSDISK
jgi:hypothetical protein